MESSGDKKLFAANPADLQMQSARVRGRCNCVEPEDGKFRELSLHGEIQDTKCDAWLMLEEMVQKAVTNQSEDFAPGLEMQPNLWSQIITLPPSIKQLKSVKKLYLYGSHLVRIPPEIGEMTNLKEFDIYTSYKLHWVPYEITRCQNLKQSRVSTRALYGNYKNRPPFPRTRQITPMVNNCSVCSEPISDSKHQIFWISLRVATDVLPLLVQACSQECIQKLPSPADGYVQHPHKGGTGVSQPARR